MKELIRHIEVLLLKHSCVIVPGLGGFVAHRVPARYVREENLFLPPHRSIGFNPDLTINDGLLVQSYMQSRNTDYPSTLKLIAQAVEKIKDALKVDGEIELGGIGRFLLKANGKLEFVPTAAGILSPNLYGLDSCTVRVIAETEAGKEKAAFHKTRQKSLGNQPSGEKKTYTFSINKEVVNYAVAALVAIVFYFCWSSPVADLGTIDSNSAKYSASVINLPSAPKAEKSSALNVKNVDSINSKSAVTQSAEVPGNKIDAEPSKHAEPLQEAKADKPYTIVLLSRVRKDNAKAFVKELESQGLDKAYVSVKPSMVRVVYGAYVSESEAYNALRIMRSENDNFRDAWVMKINK